jgi:hypothetical protein
VRITLTSTGGFTGPAGASTTTLDDSSLTAPEAQRLRTLVASLAAAAVPPVRKLARAQPWDFVQRLTIEGEGPPAAYQFHEAAAPPALRAVYDEVIRLTSERQP